MARYWVAIQQRCYTTPCAGFLVMKDLKRRVRWSGDVQKMELGVEPTPFAQVFNNSFALNNSFTIERFHLSVERYLTIGLKTGATFSTNQKIHQNRWKKK